MRVAIYGRVSTEEQAQEGFSIAAQKEKLTAFVQSQDWDIYDYYVDEGFSAKNTERPELQRLLKDVHTRKIDVVLVYKLDRLTRSVLDLYQLLQEFDSYDVKFKSATEVYDTTTAIGRLFITLVAALAQWERENLAERVKFGQEQMVHEQKRPGGRPPFGFDLREGTLVVNEDEAKIVRMIFEKYIKGSGLDGIAIELNRLGIETKFGREWSKPTVQLLLKNPAYYGALRWNYAKGGQKVNDPDEWVVIEGVYEPIIDKETYLRAQMIQETRKQKHPKELSSDFVFSGVLQCSRCGELMYGKTARSKPRETEYVQRHYICKNVKVKKCNSPLIREELLEKAFVDYVKHIADESLISTSVKTYIKPQKINDLQIEKQLVKLAERRKKWQIAFADGLIDIEDFRERVAEDRQKEQELRSHLQSRDEHEQLSNEQVVALIRNLSLVWEYSTAAEKKHLVLLLVKSMVAEVEETERKKWGKNKKITIKNLRFR